MIGEVTSPPAWRLRIGAIADVPYDVEIDAPTAATFAATEQLLTDLGHEVEETAAPFTEGDRDDFIFFFQFLSFLATRTARLSHGGHVTTADFTDYTQGMANAFKKNPGRIVGVSRRLRRARARLHEVFGRYDVLLTPTLTDLPPPLGYLGAPKCLTRRCSTGSRRGLRSRRSRTSPARPRSRCRSASTPRRTCRSGRCSGPTTAATRR